MRLLYYSPLSFGGLADYAHEQANALAGLGVNVSMLCTPEFKTRPDGRYTIVPLLKEKVRKDGRFSSRWEFARTLLRNIKTLATLVDERDFRKVLFGSYIEYLSPFWSQRLQRLAKSGVRFGAVAHDPVRDYVVGPRPWHRWSMSCGYAFLRDVFVHEPICLDTGWPERNVETTVIPHGVYRFATPTLPRETFRRQLNLPSDCKALLSFGHIRDGKNVDLIIRALVHFPELYLVVAGNDSSSGQRPAAYYQELARQCGVEDRCRWHVRFIPDEEIGNYFAACDLVMLTYSRHFHSASGVSSASIHYQKPCVASGGEGNLRSVVLKYNLGKWIEPDRLAAVVQGLEHWYKSPPHPRWKQYEQDHSWQHNAKLVLNQMMRRAIDG